ncbi:serine hydrolase domain-containing protein [Sphingopyxis sp. RIFCSPHIGHO2_12_FULL_65_19]|uniref:serine hydrolase domain-containing protein n=1 Tax=Sphingopyxis sp. RIFCSPHIGHO2_12_FULL_65_19 TaxID=1802172 RepID=UPI0008CD326A|nr:serine hydrolase domain-containing protein [Sphingopyxis sp. RIFCSPHIGHO2_12_FULL_65_19]OHD06272.1 MAG: esterase [Sphingopyxis sp. RIFCSPHIGHO2_12_FULL_65_19]
MTMYVPISGHCDPRFDAVKAAFKGNFAERGDVGAALCLIVDGNPVVDLHGGWRDNARTQKWTADTLVNLWSTTKGVGAICFALLADRGLLSYDDPVARHWPEFSAEGKEGVTIGMLLSHQSGLSGFASPASVVDLFAGAEAAARLAAQAPFWKPGSGSGYHAISIGILATELFRRIDGRSLKAFVRDELAGKLALDISIGLASEDEARRAEIIAPPEMSSADIGQLTPAQIAALANPPLDPRLPNEPAWCAADLVSANGHSNAAALARLYARFTNRLVNPATLAAATQPRIEGVDLVLGMPAQWAAGFLVNSDGIYGPNKAAFGHSGWGGSFAFADPHAKLAMSYTMNRMGTMLRDDPRDVALINAAYACI